MWCNVSLREKEGPSGQCTIIYLLVFNASYPSIPLFLPMKKTGICIGPAEVLPDWPLISKLKPATDHTVTDLNRLKQDHFEPCSTQTTTLAKEHMLSFGALKPSGTRWSWWSCCQSCRYQSFCSNLDPSCWYWVHNLEASCGYRSRWFPRIMDALIGWIPSLFFRVYGYGIRTNDPRKIVIFWRMNPVFP